MSETSPEASAAPPTEDAPLLGAGGNTSGALTALSSSSNSVASSSDQSEGTQRLWDELDQPWPSTFERSIALLASPVLPRAQAELFTKSPKPGSTPAALSRRNNLRRGYYTPDPTSVLPRHRHYNDSGQHSGDLHDSDRFDGQALSKVQSLDFGSSTKVRFTSDESGNEIMAKRQQSAKDYRAKILAQQPKTAANKQKQQQYDTTKSPGYDREVASLRAKKEQQQQQQTNGHGAPLSDAKSSVAQSAFNLANILMGVGLLGLPYAFKVAGVLGGSLCVVVFGYMAWRTTLLIGQELNGDPRPSAHFDESPYKSPLPAGLPNNPASRMLPPLSSFPEIARESFGEVGCLILSVVLYFELFSCICIFFVTMGDHLHQLFPAVAVKMHMVLVASLSIIPAIVLRTPTLLSYLSMVGTVATVCVVLAVLAAALAAGDLTEELAAKKGIEPDPDADEDDPYHILWDTSGLTLALGLVAYCFSGHAIVPSIYCSMQEPQKFDRMATLTFLAVLVCCALVGLSGYYMFGSLVADQVTLSMEEVVQAKMIMKGLVWLMVLTAFSKTTLTLFPLALGMEEIVAPFLTSDGAIGLTSALVKVVLIGLALLVAIFVPSFSYICALVGMICTMSVSIILPAAAHLKMFGSRLSFIEKALDWIFVFVGFFIAIAGTAATV